jgi:hypothetical protein
VNPLAQRAAEQRQAKLDAIAEQVEAGSLVVRQMTAEERERYPPKPPVPRPKKPYFA